MPKRAEASETNILHPTYVWARLYVRNGIYHTSIHHLRRTTSISVEGKTEKIKRDNLCQAMEKLDERLDKYLHPETTIIAPKSKTIGGAFQEYITYLSKSVEKGSIQKLFVIFNRYLIEDMELSDTNSEAIRENVNLSLSKLKYAQNTINGHLSKLRSFFKFCIEAQYCTVNPIPKLMIPGKIVPEVIAFAQSEIDGIIDQLRTGNNYIEHTVEREELILLIRLLSTTGMRISEALKLTKKDISEDGIRIDGKRRKKNEKKVRFFPFKYLPEVRGICEELENFNKSSKKVFSWNNSKNPGDNLKSAMLELGMDTKNKSFHSLRKMALNRWEKEVGYPEEVRNMLAGNSSAVKKHYYLPLGMQDTINKIDSLKNFSV